MKFVSILSVILAVSLSCLACNDDSDSANADKNSASENNTDNGNQTNTDNNSNENNSNNNNSNENGDNSGNSSNDKYGGANVKINEVPASQDNVVSHSCDQSTFVEFCDGTKVVYCSSRGTVATYECGSYAEGGETGYHCAVALDDDNMNLANCVAKAPSDKTLQNFCTADDHKANKKETQCDYYQLGYEYYEYEYIYACLPYTDGYYHWTEAGGKLCSDLCTKGCTQTACSPDDDDICSGNVLKTCKSIGSENVYAAVDCDAYTTKAKCSVDQEGYGACE